MTSNHSAYPASNLTWQILNHANESNYAVGAYNWYVNLKTQNICPVPFLTNRNALATTTTESWP